MLTSSTVQAGSRIGPSRAHEQGALAVGVAGLDDVLVGRQGGGIAAGADEPRM